MKRLALFVLCAFAVVSTALADTPAASAVMNKAMADAKAQKKNIFVMFDASW